MHCGGRFILAKYWNCFILQFISTDETLICLSGALARHNNNILFIGFQEVQRIKNEHPDDACAVVNDRVKGSLKVTRAFGAGFLKQVYNDSRVIFSKLAYIHLCVNY